jgi:hypothetical protein
MKSSRKETIGIPRCRRENDIKKERGFGNAEWIQAAQDRDQ